MSPWDYNGDEMWTAEELARFFHETTRSSLRSAGVTGETREATRVEWEDVPDNNKSLMIAVAGYVLDAMERDGLFDNPLIESVHLHELEGGPIELSDESVQRIAKAVAQEVRPAWVDRGA